MTRTILGSIRMALLTLVVTGFLYPLAVTAVASLLFPRAAAGSLVIGAGGKVIGSELIGQRFTNPAYFQGRPSAAGSDGYDPTASGGSNWGVTSAKLGKRARDTAAALRTANPAAAGDAIPVDLLAASGSGLDPHLTPEAAYWQAPRVAAARNVGVDRVREAVAELIELPTLGLLGEPRVNVLQLNLALDRRFGAPPAGPTATAPGGDGTSP